MAEGPGTSGSRDNLPGVILAGGRSSRMGGGDKCLLPLGDAPLLQTVIDRLRPQLGALALNANGDAGRFDAFGLPVISDGLPDQPGPLAGVLAAMDWAAAAGADQVITVAADTPFFPTTLVAELRAGRGAAPIALAASRDAEGAVRRQPTFGLWSVALRARLRRDLQAGMRKVGLWCEAQGAVTVVFDHAPDAAPFFNVNTPEDLEEARVLAARRRA